MFNTYQVNIKTIQIDDAIKISIPSERNWFLIASFSIFLFIWITVEFLFFSGQIFENLQSAFPFLFWFFGWAAFGIFSIRMLLWHTIGKTIIIKGIDILTIRKKGMLFSRPRHFEMFEIKNFFIQNRNLQNSKFITRKKYIFPDRSKTFAFEYKNEVIRAVDWITVYDAEFLMAKLN